MDKNWKLAEAKKKIDGMVGLPNVKMRKGVARSGGALTGWTDYNYKLMRDEARRWTLYIEWVDTDGEGNRVVLPHELVEAIRRASDNLITQALKERGQAAAATRSKKQQGGD